jgi:predicted DNA-binding transcriptional regulator AlpA
MDDDSGNKTEEYLTIPELAERIKFSPQTIYNMISAGRFAKGIHYFKPSAKKVLFLWPAVRAWIERNDMGNTNEIDRTKVSRIKI